MAESGLPLRLRPTIFWKAVESRSSGQDSPPNVLTHLALLGLLSAVQAGVAQSHTISGGQPLRISIAVAAGRVVIGEVEQGEIDLVVTLAGPDGQRLGEFDSRSRSTEWFAFEAISSGTQWLEIRPAAANVREATFTVRVTIGQASEETERQVQAVALHTQAKRLFARGDGESMREALATFRRVRPIWASLGDSKLELAAVASIGDALYSTSEYAAAENVYREALAMSQAAGDMRTQAEVLNNLAMVAWPLGEVREAFARLSEALPRWQAVGHQYGEASAYSNRGILHWETGDYDRARQDYSRALDLFGKIGDARGQAYAHSNLGVLLEALGEQRQALAQLGRSIVLFRRVGDSLAEGRAETRRARIHLALGNVEFARSAATRALRLIRPSPDRLAEADAISQMGRLLDASAHSLLARAEYHRALGLYQRLESRRGMADALHFIGVSHLSSGDAINAIPFLTQARQLRRTLGLGAVEAESLYAMARAERMRNDLALARSHLEAAIAVVDKLRLGVLEKQLRVAYTESKHQYYAAYIDLLVELHLREPGAGYDRLAFEAAERSRARGLTELLRESWSSVAAAVPPDLIAREKSLRAEINYWSWQLWQRASRPAGAARDAEVTLTLSRLVVDHDQAEADIRRSDPRYAAILHPEQVPLKALQEEAIDQDAVLLMFHLGAERSFVWAVTPEALRLEVLPGRAEVERLVHRYLDLVRRRDAVARPGAERDAATALAGVVLQPIADVIGRRRVLIAADGVLHYVPFAALPRRVGGQPLSQSNDTLVVPSVTMLALLRRELAGRTPAPGRLAVIADPVYSASDPRVRTPLPSQLNRGTPDRQFARLPHSRDEADRIAAMVAPSLSLKALDFQSTRALATSNAMGQYRFVHLATHAVQDERRPSLSGIVLSMVDATGVAQDGFLRLHDVYNLKLRADLVVLSACDTAIGPERRGDGIASLARGLFHAGAARVISTLWQVDDEATAHFMGLLYQQLLSPSAPSPSTALRLAQAGMRDHPRWSHPYFWAGFVLQGEW